MPYNTLLIDLDDTIYPSSCGLWDDIRSRINQYLYEKMHFPLEDIPAIRLDLFSRYGTTLRGLKALHQVNEQDYLEFVHNAPLSDYINPDPELNAMLLRYSQRRIIFTNADDEHANRVLNTMQLTDCFEQIIDVNAIAPYCKPMKEAYEKAFSLANITDPSECVFADDSIKNLDAAREFGVLTILINENSMPSNGHLSIKHLKDLPNAFPF
ncbi:MAG: pyrimidine 5'-nucleotidase [Anaerolineaceae bacterium]|nr:pyrimidine 5'-nucleotidase [Anaerolineaceae bacterium]